MKRCKKCILNENFPGISFDENGICNFCNQHQDEEQEKILIKKYKDKFNTLIAKHRNRSSYDCIAAYSGGKDSTYTLHLLKNKFDLNILAFSFDNWYQSDYARNNIKRVLKKLNIDLINFMPGFKAWKDIINTVVNDEFYSKKHIQRASDICTTCISMIRFSCLKIAMEKEIPFIIFGMSPGQAPMASSIFKTNTYIVKQMQDIVYGPLKEKLGDEIDPYFLKNRHFQSSLFPYIINPLAFMKYDEEKIYDIIKSYGWEEPEDTDSNSTNCLINAMANQIHIDKYGFHPYAYELSELVRKGFLKREKALEAVQAQQNQNIIRNIKHELEL
jgi:tRNA(Ile)-lysidine synthase TilS/MesJ